MLVTIGLPSWAKPWLGDFDFALPAIGVIGMWATMGFCMVLFLAGVSAIMKVAWPRRILLGIGVVLLVLSLGFMAQMPLATE